MTIAPPTAIAELRHWPRWVLWRTVERDGKATKVPFQPNGKPASSTDPETWSEYSLCQLAHHRGGFDGLGYVFGPNPETGELEYAGIDLDHCVVDGKVTFGAMAIVRRLDSYTEFSPSGDGLHIIVRARINGSRNRTKNTPWGGDFESYDQGRFFTVTGKHIPGTPETIEARQEELDAIRAELFPPEMPKAAGYPLQGNGSVPLDDVALEEKIRKSKSGPKFDRLMAGDKSEYGDDDSAADLALCNILAWWLQGDAARMDAWFRRSGLYREKWEREDYRERTINEGISSCANGFYNPSYREREAAALAGREQEFDSALVEIAVMCALPDDDEFVNPWRTGDGTAYRYYLPTRQGKALDLDPLRSFTTAPKMNVEIASQLKTVPAIQAKDMPRFIALLGRACELRREMTLDDRIGSLMVSYVQEAPEYVAAMDNDQQSRVTAFRWLDRQEDPLADARSATQVSRNAPIIVDPNTGLQFVRQAWFHAYVKYHLGAASVDRLAGRVEMLGWMRRGRNGRIKATPTDGGKELFDHFYVIPREWGQQHG